MFVYGTYALEGEAYSKFYKPNNISNFCRQVINCMRAWNYLQKTSDLPLTTEIIKQTHKIMMEHRKDILAGEYKKSHVFAGYHIFASASHIEKYMEDAIFRFHEYPYSMFHQYPSIWRWKRKNMLLDFGSCFDTDKMLSISSNFKLLS